MPYDGEDRRDPERLSLPKWFTPVVTALIIGVSGVMYQAHNSIIINTGKIDYMKQEVQELRDENRQNKAEISLLKEKHEKYYDETLEGVNELLARKRRRE